MATKHANLYDTHEMTAIPKIETASEKPRTAAELKADIMKATKLDHLKPLAREIQKMKDDDAEKDNLITTIVDKADKGVEDSTEFQKQLEKQKTVDENLAKLETRLAKFKLLSEEKQESKLVGMVENSWKKFALFANPIVEKMSAGKSALGIFATEGWSWIQEKAQNIEGYWKIFLASDVVHGLLSHIPMIGKGIAESVRNNARVVLMNDALKTILKERNVKLAKDLTAAQWKLWNQKLKAPQAAPAAAPAQPAPAATDSSVLTVETAEFLATDFVSRIIKSQPNVGGKEVMVSFNDLLNAIAAVPDDLKEKAKAQAGEKITDKPATPK